MRPGLRVRRALGALLAAAFASGCGDGTLWVANGLDVPVKVTVGGQPPVQVDPDSRKSFTLKGGVHPCEAVTLDGKGRETASVDVPRGGTVVYNVAGAAPLYVLTAYYSTVPAAGKSHSEILCGVRTFQRDVNYYFAEPPPSITTEESSVVKSSLLQETGGWKTCLNMLSADGKDLQAANMMPAVRAMHAPDDAAWYEARLWWIAGEDPRALALVREVAKQAGTRDAHLAYAQFAAVMGGRRELLEEYRTGWGDLPPSERRYLAARLLPPAQSVAELQALAREHPDDAGIRLSLAWSLDRAGRFADALAALQPLGDGASLPNDDRHRLLRRQMWSLAALGRNEQAVQALRDAASKLHPINPVAMATWGLLAQKSGHADLEPEPRFIQQGAQGGEAEWRQVTYDALVHPERLDQERLAGLKYTRALAPLLAKAAADPHAALLDVHRASSYDAQLIPEPLAMVLWGEACRTGDQYAEERLRHALLSESVDFSALCAYVREGKPAEDLAELWEDRAAVHLARARALRARGDALAAAAEEALVRRHDWYGGPATRALESWPSTAPASAQGTTRLASAQVGRPQPGRAVAEPVPPPKKVEHTLTRVEGVHLEPAP